jgi:uncharacterized repeat protein (TIGR03803 family)
MKTTTINDWLTGVRKGVGGASAGFPTIGGTDKQQKRLTRENLRQRAAFAARRSSFALLLAFALSSTAHAQTTYQVIKFFDGLGINPTALIEGTDGILYGTLQAGGRKGEGVVFKLKRDGSGYSVLHHFTGYLGGEDGSAPQGVVEGSDGALYGTTESGGLHGDDLHPTGSGTIFKLKKDGSGYTVLHRFPGLTGDGIGPWAGLVEGRDGAFYGTTLLGGTKDGGTAFKLKKDGSGYTVLHSFLRSETDGFKPMAGLLAGSDGALYGTTDAGGSGHSGTVFRLGPDGSDYKLLHSFAVEPSDGRFPRSSLVEGRDGTLYGTTENGGTRDAGTVFKLNKDGSGYRLLHSFTGSLGLKPDPQGLMQGVSNGVTTKFSDAGEGMGPTGLVQGSDGALYGTTEHHGKNGGGTLFRLNPDGGNFAVLHNFPVAQGDGQNPWAKMVHGSDGSILGTTKICSTNNFGTVFRLSIFGSNPEPTPRSK